MSFPSYLNGIINSQHKDKQLQSIKEEIYKLLPLELTHSHHTTDKEPATPN